MQFIRYVWWCYSVDNLLWILLMIIFSATLFALGVCCLNMSAGLGKIVMKVIFKRVKAIHSRNGNLMQQHMFARGSQKSTTIQLKNKSSSYSCHNDIVDTGYYVQKIGPDKSK